MLCVSEVNFWVCSMVFRIVTQWQPFLFQAVSAVALFERSFQLIAHDCAAILKPLCGHADPLCAIVQSIVRECTVRRFLGGNFWVRTIHVVFVQGK